MQQGPCLEHCYSASFVTIAFARAAFVYVIACVGYLLMTRQIGTPFNDSLTEEQKKIKREAASIRRSAFIKSLLIGCVIVAALKPFTKIA